MGPKLFIACLINLLAVSTVFMTQPIFTDLSAAFTVDITKARYAFSVVSLFYTVSFFFLGPAADKFDLPRISVIGLFFLSISIFYFKKNLRLPEVILILSRINVMVRNIDFVFFCGYSWLCEKGRAETLPYIKH